MCKKYTFKHLQSRLWLHVVCFIELGVQLLYTTKNSLLHECK